MSTKPPELACTKRADNGRLCPFPPVPGDDKCRELHGGRENSRQLRRRYNMLATHSGNGPIKNINIVREKNGMPHMGDPIEIDPGVALLQEIHRTAGHVQWLAAKVQSLEEDDMVWSKSLAVDETSMGDDGKNYTLTRQERKAEISKWYDIYEKERRHLATISAAALKAGIEERRVRLAERGVDALEAAITAALTDLGVDPHTERARRAIGNRLREVLGASDDLYGFPDAQPALEAARAPRVIDAREAQYWAEQNQPEEWS